MDQDKLTSFLEAYHFTTFDKTLDQAIRQFLDQVRASNLGDGGVVILKYDPTLPSDSCFSVARYEAQDEPAVIVVLTSAERQYIEENLHGGA